MRAGALAVVSSLALAGCGIAGGAGKAPCPGHRARPDVVYLPPGGLLHKDKDQVCATLGAPSHTGRPHGQEEWTYRLPGQTLTLVFSGGRVSAEVSPQVDET